MKVRFTPRALLEAERVHEWWRENRLDAPDAFEEELKWITARIAERPTLGTIYPSKQSTTVRRVRLPRSNNHVYFTVTETEIVVLSIWGAPRRPVPPL